MLASSSSSSGSLGRHGFMASMNSVIGTSSKEKRKRRATKKDKKPPPPSTDETQGMLMRDFAEGVILQDYAKDESSESGKSSSTKTSGSLSPSFKNIRAESWCDLLMEDIDFPTPPISDTIDTNRDSGRVELINDY